MNKIKVIGIYKITSPIGKVYIGQSTDIFRRFYQYKKLINCTEQHKLYNSFLKYGVDNHVFEILCTCSEKELNDMEIYYGDLFNATSEKGLNIRNCGGSNGRHNPETIKKLSELRKGYKHPLYGKLGENNPNYGSRRSEETKKLQSYLKKGKYNGVNNPNYGKDCKETKNKISIKAKERLYNKANHPMFNKKHKDEAIQKMRDKKLGKKLSPESIAKREETRKLLREERRIMVF